MNTQSQRPLSGIAWGGPQLLLFLVALLLLGGWRAGRWREAVTDRALRRSLVTQVLAVAQGIDAHLVKQLEFTAADTAKPAFHELRQQLADYGRAVGLPRVYCQALRQGKLLMGPGNFEQENAWSQGPGTSCGPPDPPALEVLRSGGARCSNPEESGVHGVVSAFASVSNPETGKPVALVRIDVDAPVWDGLLRQHRRAPILGAASLALAFAGGSWWLRRRLHSPKASAQKLRYTEVFLVLWGGALLTAGGAWLAHDREARLRNEVFAEFADSQASALQTAERDIRNSLRTGLARLLQPETNLTRAVFERYATSLLPASTVQSFIWVRRVPAEDRPKVEDELSSELDTRCRIFELGTNRTVVPAGPRSVYYPVMYVQPLPQLGKPVGYDLGSEPERRRAIEAAETSGLPRATGPVPLIHQGRPMQGFLAVQPLYDANADGDLPGRVPRGFCGAVVAYPVLFERALGRVGPADQLARFDCFEVEQQGRLRWAFSPSANANPASSSRPIAPRGWFSTELELVRPVFVFGKAYIVKALPGNAFLRAHPRVDGVLAGVLGMLLTGVTAALVGSLRGRNERLEQEVQERTRALRESEQFTRQIIANAGQGIIVYDAELKHCYWNVVMETLSGMAAAEVLGKHASTLNELFPPAANLPLIQQALGGRTVHSPDIFYRVPNSDKAGWMSAMYGPNLGAEGEVVGVIAVIRDITERKQTERSLQKSEVWHRVLFENSSDACFVLDGQTLRFTRANPAALKMFGVASERDMTVMNPLDLSPEFQPDGRRSGARSREIVRTAVDKGSVSFEWTHCRMSGEEFCSAVLLTRMDLAGQLFFQVTVRDITREKMAAELLSQRTALLSGLLDSIPDLVFFKSRAGVYLACNPEFSRFVGRSREEIAGLTDYDIFGSDLADSFLSEERLVWEAGTPRHTEDWLTYPDGRQVLFETLRAPFRSEKNELLGIIGVSRDITERKRAEDALQARQEKLDSLFRAAPIALGVTVNRVLMEVNESLCQMTGYAASELVGRSARQLYPDDAEFLRVGTEGQELLAREGTSMMECRWLRKDGRIIDVLLRISMIARDHPSKGMVFTGLDITERKTAEQALHSTASRLRMLWQAVEQSLTSVVITDTAGLIEYVNPKFVEVTGYSAEEVLGQNPRMLKSDATPTEYYRELWQTITAGSNWHGEFLNRRKNGELYWESAVISPVKDERGNITHFLGIKQDITERKKFEAELQESNHQLMEATGRANAMAAKAEAANGAKSQFLANVSHEIRTPLNGIIGTTSLLLETPLNAEQLKYAEIARSSGDALLALINDILDLSKIEAQKLELDCIDFDLRATVAEATQLLSLKASEKGLSLLCEIDPKVPQRLRGDPGRFRQILMNLGGNAVKFTPSGGVSIQIRLESRDTTHLTLRVEVADTGIGIAREKLPMLFAPFTQVDGSITRRFGGTGLGLSISKQLAELMGGRIGVESELGKGAKFWFTARLEEAAEPSAAPALEPISLVGLKVLIVADDATRRLTLAGSLSKWGCRCVAVAQQAPEALSVLQAAAAHADPFRIALIDVADLAAEALALGEMVKSIPGLDETRLILLRPGSAPLTPAEFERTGIVACLQKPFRVTQLEAGLREWAGSQLKRNPSSRPLAHPEHAAVPPPTGLRVLVAEDNLPNQLVVAAILKKLGHEAEVVNSGSAAIRALQMARYDLVLMDCQMPEMDGFEATRRIRRGEAGANNAKIPVVALTANAMEDQRERSLLAGMNEHICKPFKAQALAQVLVRWCGQSSTDRDPGREAPAPVLLPAVPATEASAHGVIFNQTDFLSRMMGDHELAARVALGFVNELPKQLALLNEAIDQQQTALAKATAHRLKGAAAAVGGENFRQLAAEMEKAAHNGDLPMLNALSADLPAAAAALATALCEFSKTESPAEPRSTLG